LLGQRGVVGIGVVHPHQGPGLAGGAARKHGSFEQQGLDPAFGKMERGAGAVDASADDNDICTQAHADEILSVALA
jgi:hypothetical protein